MKRDTNGHVFREKRVTTALGDYDYVQVCKNCGASEFDEYKCTPKTPASIDYIEKALKAVASYR